MKIRPVEAELIHADRKTYQQNEAFFAVLRPFTGNILIVKNAYES